MGYEDGLLVLAEGRKVENDNRLWSQYVAIYPYMDEDSFISFKDFKEGAFKPTEKPKTVNEILLSVEHIIDLTVR